MPNISKINPGNGTEYDIKDSNAQTKILSSPINIRGTNFTEVESTLQELTDITQAVRYSVDDENLILTAGEMFSENDENNDFLVNADEI
mgnify:CR=1 FL=1